MNKLDVKEIRKSLGLTQTELAERLAVSLITIQNWERGRTIPSTKYKILCTLRDSTQIPSINNQQGENIHYTTSTSAQLDKALEEMAEQRKMYATHIDRLLSIIEQQNK